MTEQAGKFAVVLYELEIPAELIRITSEVFRENPELVRVLESPVVPKDKKHRILERVVEEMKTQSGLEMPLREVRQEKSVTHAPAESFRRFLHFLDKVCDDGCIGQLEDIFQGWRSYKHQQEGVLEAELSYVTEPDEDQLVRFREFLCRRYHKKEVILHTVSRPELLGGFVLKTGDVEYDYSLAGRMKKLRRTLVNQQA